MTDTLTAAFAITYYGQLPSKSNFRRGGADWRRRWARIKQAESDIGWLAHQAGAQRALEGERVRLSLWAWGQRCDASNIPKLAADALIGVCYADDKGVEVGAVDMGPGEPRVEIRVEYLREEEE